MTENKMLFSRRDLLNIVLPLIIQQVLAVTIGMVDSMMVSYAGEAAVAGVSLVNTLDVLLVVSFTSLVTGGSVVVSQFLGKKDLAAARSASKQLLYVSTGIALIITTAVLLFRGPLLTVLFGDAKEDVMESAQGYFFFVAISFPFLAIEGGVAAIFRVMGNSVVSMYVSVGMNLINVAGNALLIMGFGMGAVGAAIATLVARIAGSAVLLILIRNRKNVIYIDDILSYRPDIGVIRKILQIGIPNGIENSMFQFGKLLTQSLISSMPTYAIAANAVANTLANFQYMPGTAFSNTMITVVGRCIGAGEKEQAKKYTRVLTFSTYVSLWAIVIGTFILSSAVIGMYDLSTEAGELANELIIYHAICAAAIWPVAFTLPASFRAASDVRFPLVVSMFSMWAFRVALSYVFSLESVTVFGHTFAGLGMGAMGVWVAMTVDWLFRAILFVYRHFSGRWLKVYKAK